MKKKRFEEWEYSEINKEFGYTRYFEGFNLVEEWLESDILPNEFETKQLENLRKELLYNTETWNEDELKMFFIAPFFHLIDFKNPNYKLFTQRKFSGIIGDWELNGVFDLIVSKGEQHPEEPYFFLHEYKQERKKENDPLGQLLAAMLVAQHKNEKKIPLYGCYVVGRYYFFVVLDDKKYGVSNSLNACNSQEITKIFSMMRWIKQKIDKLVENK